MFFIGRILLHFFYLPSERNGGQKTGTNFINIILKVEINLQHGGTQKHILPIFNYKNKSVT